MFYASTLQDLLHVTCFKNSNQVLQLQITTDFQHRKKYGMNSQLPSEKDTEIANDDEDIDFSNFYYDKMHLDKIQSHKISLPDLLNEFDTLNDEGMYQCVL